MANLDRLFLDLVQHEALRLKPYRCSAGKLTIGVGRNLEDKGITEQEAYMLLANDIKELQRSTILIAIVKPHNTVRQEVLLNMAFNLGITRFLGFKKMLAALKQDDYDEAARQMLNSRWARQVKGRAIELARWMKTGVRNLNQRREVERC